MMVVAIIGHGSSLLGPLIISTTLSVVCSVIYYL